LRWDSFIRVDYYCRRMSSETLSFSSLARLVAKVEPFERRALALAFTCNFVMMGSYYIIRPVRDAMATVFGVAHLQELFTGTLIFTLLVSPLFAWITDTFRLSRVLPGVFCFIIASLAVFFFWFEAQPESRVLAASYYWWASVINLFMVSVFWSLVVDTFTSGQAARLLPAISASGSIGAIAGPLVASVFVKSIGVPALLLIAAVGFAIVVVLVLWLIREKSRLQQDRKETQASTMERNLQGNMLDGFVTIFKSPILRNQAAFMLLMTWISTIGYFIQTDLVARTFSDIESRTRALAEIDLAVNVISALIAMFGLTRFINRFGVTGSLVLNPILMALSFVFMALSPTLRVLQAMQVTRRVIQYAIARPSREICFTVVDQESRYKAKNILDVVVYRLGDLSAAWVQSGMNMLGFAVGGGLGLGLVASAVWGATAWSLGRQYERMRAEQGEAGPRREQPGVA
jgi:ATP:ADP antiporter, AAA family